MTTSTPKTQRRRPAFFGADTASGPDETAHTLLVPHLGRPGCGYTLLLDEQIPLYRLGLFPLRCKSCKEMITDVREGA